MKRAAAQAKALDAQKAAEDMWQKAADGSQDAQGDALEEGIEAGVSAGSD